MLAAVQLNRAAARSVHLVEGYLRWSLPGALTAARQRLPAPAADGPREAAVRRVRRTTGTALTVAATASIPVVTRRTHRLHRLAGNPAIHPTI
jgi:hypothetical protein